jgi:hypothetical protein
MNPTKNAVFWDVTPCLSCKNRRFGGMYRINHKVDKIQRTGNNVNINYQPKHAAKKCLIIVTMMMEDICSFEMSVLKRATRHNIQEEGILHNHRSENLISYLALTD